MIVDTICTIIVVLAFLFFALCYMAGKSDEISEEEYQAFLKEKGYKDD